MVDKNFGLGKTLKDIYKNTKPDESAAFYSLQAADKSLAEKQQSLAKEQQNQKKIDQLESENEKLKESNYVDDLTGLENRKALNHYINELNTKTLRYPLVCFIFDINDLKKTNDTLGHTAGDELLKSTANIIKQLFRQDEDRIFRSGDKADEFTVLTTLNPKTPDSISVNQFIGNKMNQLMKTNKEFTFDDITLPFEIAVGAVEYNNEKHKNLELLIAEADQKMLQNKKAMKKEEADEVQEPPLASNNLLD